MGEGPLTVRCVAVGSTNPAKVEAVRSVVERIWPAAEIRPVEVDSGVSNMPMSDAETRRGALIRARAALEVTDADLAIGLEGGVDSLPEGMFVCGWVAAVDRHGRVGMGASGRIPLPPVLARAVAAGQELGPAMDALSGMRETRRGPGTVGILTNGLITRPQAFAFGVAYALTPFLHPEWYADG
ncbi:MAG: inosine/xanthosine triphosphatase [Chloroflexi bacterium]|nr:inosine/xanthosine triphosphatase [Chloroflexota bacterium]